MWDQSDFFRNASSISIGIYNCLQSGIRQYHVSCIINYRYLYGYHNVFMSKNSFAHNPQQREPCNKHAPSSRSLFTELFN